MTEAELRGSAAAEAAGLAARLRGEEEAASEPAGLSFLILAPL